MVKLKSKSIRVLTLGMINRKNIYFKPGEIKDLPDSPEYSEIIAEAVSNGFLEIVNSEKKSFIKKIIPKKEHPKKEFQKEEVKNDSEEDSKSDKEKTN